MNVCCVLLLTAAAVLADGSVLTKRAGCSAEYRKIGEVRNRLHTMCDPFYDRSPELTSSGISAADKKFILDKHNEYRRNPGQGMKTSNSLKVYWDDKVAAVAQHYADSCVYPNKGAHDKLRDVPGYGVGIGQNLAYGYPSWEAVISGWFSEVKNFVYGGAKKGVVGHYTQLVLNRIPRIGCGFALCGKNGRVYTCNYVGIQYSSETQKPFLRGAPCAKCPNSCNNGLCDCKGKHCYHQGKLNIDTCVCKCTTKWGGEMCEIEGGAPPSGTTPQTTRTTPRTTRTTPRTTRTTYPTTRTTYPTTRTTYPTTRTTPRVYTNPPSGCYGGNCQDQSPYCARWAAFGLCSGHTEAAFVRETCPQSCP